MSECCCKNNCVNTGTIIYSHIVQPGYIKADGRFLSRCAYDNLFRFAFENQLILSENDWANNMQGMFAEGDGANTFRVPDLRGQFLRGVDDGASFDSGRTLGSKQSQSTTQHQHEVPVPFGTYTATVRRESWEFGEGEEKIRVANTLDKGIQCESVCVALSSQNRKEIGETRPINIALIAQIKY